MDHHASVARWDTLPLDTVTEMVARKVIAAGGQMRLQTYLKQGALDAVVADRGVTVREGEVLRVPAGAVHQAEALADSFVLDWRT